MIKIAFRLFNLLIFSGLPQISSAQVFVEVCPSDMMNGTMVHCTNVNDTLYGTGFFTAICGSSTSYISKWDGTTWLPTTIPLPSAGHTLKEINNQFFIGTYVDAVDSNWVYEYDGVNLNKWGEGVYLTTATGFSELPNIYDIIEFNNQVYACGEFDKVGDQSISGIMRWNGTAWEDVGGGLSGNIQGGPPIMYPHQMVVHNNELCVVGNFRYAGGVEVNGVAKWNGSTWSALGSGFNSTVYGVGVYNGELFVGGDFTQSGSQTLKRIAKWNGTDWVSPGFGFEPISTEYTFVHTFFEDNGELYIAGGIRQIELDVGGIVNCGGIIRYSSTSIETFYGGIANTEIEAIGKTSDGDILIGGATFFGTGHVAILNDTLVGIDEIEASISLSPNPMTDVLKIESDQEITSLKLLDIKGRQLKISYLDKHTLDVSKLEDGIYILHYTTESSTGSQRLLK